MKKLEKVYRKDGYTLRLATAEDAEPYYQNNFDPLDPEISRFTGCKPQFTRDEVVSFFLQCLEDGNRFDFLLLDSTGKILGESVLNEIDWDLRCANFRTAIFHPLHRGKGLGTWMVQCALNYAFETLKLHRVELDVFSFNRRAESAYQKAGFRREGILRDAILDGETYADDILMAILEEEWYALQGADS